MNTAIVSACFAYVIWGLFPLYIKQLPGVPAIEIVLHRAWWAMVFVVALLAWQRRFAWLKPVLTQPRALASAAACALLIGANWLLYVWAVAGGRVVDASLGYFINPLFNVLLGTLVLGERPRPVQWLAVALAAAGVGWLVLGAGEWPWVALLLAATFGGYGLLRKTAALGAMEGLALETMLLAPVAGAGLLWLVAQGQDAVTHQGPATFAWLLAAGPFTAIPLLLFARGARGVSLATLGLLQYIGPTLQFLLGVMVYGEPFHAERAIGFAFIWAGLVVYSGEGLWRLRAPRAAH